MKPSDVNLYLVGFMGTGKTTVGWAVAQRLGFAFLDSDREIERTTGRTIPEIFAADGEQAFRALERRFVLEGHPAARTVVSCGGGLVIPEGMAALLQERGVVECLHASIETILERTSRQGDRPLLDAPDREARARELFAAREPIYRQAGTLVLTDGRPLKEVTAHVIRIWARDATEFARARSGGQMPG